ncbi:MAG: ParA family protein [Candidatus Riflebacteria bacterium]|nr:ParA family protein [Candidatus Riflebacteria bacterium]
MSKTIFNIVSQKGGCGKTTVALLIAKICKYLGKSSLILDLDFTGTSMKDIFADTSNDKFNVFDSPSSSSGTKLEELLTPGPFDISHKAWTEKITESILPIPDSDLSVRIDCIPSNTGPKSYRKVSPFLEIEAESGFLAKKSRQLILHLWNKYGVFILDNGPGITGLSQGLMEPSFENAFQEKDLKFINLHLTACDRQDIIQTFKSYFDYYLQLRKEILRGTGKDEISVPKDRETLINWVKRNIIIMNKISDPSEYKDRFVQQLKSKFDPDTFISFPEPLTILDSSKASVRFEESWPGLKDFGPAFESAKPSPDSAANFFDFVRANVMELIK